MSIKRHGERIVAAVLLFTGAKVFGQLHDFHGEDGQSRFEWHLQIRVLFRVLKMCFKSEKSRLKKVVPLVLCAGSS